jgi:hypothetical protein
MKLTERALEAINTKRIRPLIALALDKSEQTIIRYISNNDDALTKAAVIQIIRRETDLKEKEILEADRAIA